MRWLLLARIACGMVLVTILFCLAVLFDKPDLGWLVGPWFLPIVSCGLIAGSLLMLIACWKTPVRRPWQRWFLLIWALIGATSPAFGFLFLGPWSVMALMLPVVIWILFAKPVPHPNPQDPSLQSTP